MSFLNSRLGSFSPEDPPKRNKKPLGLNIDRLGVGFGAPGVGLNPSRAHLTSGQMASAAYNPRAGVLSGSQKAAVHSIFNDDPAAAAAFALSLEDRDIAGEKAKVSNAVVRRLNAQGSFAAAAPEAVAAPEAGGAGGAAGAPVLPTPDQVEEAVTVLKTTFENNRDIATIAAILRINNEAVIRMIPVITHKNPAIQTVFYETFKEAFRRNGQIKLALGDAVISAEAAQRSEMNSSNNENELGGGGRRRKSKKHTRKHKKHHKRTRHNRSRR